MSTPFLSTLMRLVLRNVLTSGTMQFYVFVAVGTMVSHMSNELREQELRYRGIFDHSEAGVFLIGRQDST